MDRVFAALAGALFMMMAGGASAQLSNSFEALPDQPIPDQPVPGDGTATAYNPVLFQPASFSAMLSELGMTVVSSQAIPDYNGHLVVATVDSVPFLFGFSECAADGCALLSQVHPAPTSLAGLYITPVIANSLNVEFPLGTIIAEDNGNLVYRYGLPATPGCEADCMSVHVELFFLSVNELYGYLTEMAGMNEASLQSDEALRALTGDMPGAADLYARAAGADGFSAADMDHLAGAMALSGRGLEMDRLLEVMSVGSVIDGVGQDAWSPLVTGQ